MNQAQVKNIRELVIDIISRAKVRKEIDQNELNAIIDYISNLEIGNKYYRAVMDALKGN